MNTTNRLELGDEALASHTPQKQDPLATAAALAELFAGTAAERDVAGGTPLTQRQAVRDSGLLKLSIPQSFGGLGADWPTVFKSIRIIAQTDSSLAQVYGFQFLMLASVRLYGTEQQWQAHYRATAAGNLWWGNALNPLDQRTIAERVSLNSSQDIKNVQGFKDTQDLKNSQGDAQDFLFSGHKSFCSGATDSDMLIVSALEQPGQRFLVAAVPTTRDGIRLNDDWNNMGQRQTDSGSAEFTSLQVHAHEVLDTPGPLSSAFSSLRSLIAQLIFTNIYLGIADGALAEGVKYTSQNSRLWAGSLASSIFEDPYTLLHYGEFWSSLEGPRVLADRAAVLLDAAWNKDLALDYRERGEVALAVSAAKVTISKAGLDVTTRIFEVAGARATTAKIRLDRFWRNLRVYTLHDPVDYKLKDLGDWALNGKYPDPSFYS